MASCSLRLELLVARAWRQRLPFVELLAVRMPQQAPADYERDRSRCSPAEQTKRLQKAA